MFFSKMRVQNGNDVEKNDRNEVINGNLVKKNHCLLRKFLEIWPANMVNGCHLSLILRVHLNHMSHRLHFSSLDQSAKKTFPSDVHLTMRVLLAVSLVVVGSSMRMDASNETQLPKAGKGEKCSCYKTPIAEQDCCAEGLVCSKSRHICKPALGSPCKNHFVKELFGISECSIGSYQEDSKRKILCHPTSETESMCCVKKGSVLPAWIPPGKGSFSLCCTGRGYIHSKTLEGMQMWEMAEDIREHVCYED